MNGEQLLVMSVVIELWSEQGPRVVGDGVNLIWIMDGEDASNGVSNIQWVRIRAEVKASLSL